VLHAGGGSSQKKIGEQLVAMRAHSHQIAVLRVGAFHDLARRLAETQLSRSWNAGGLKFRFDAIHVGAAFINLFPDRISAVKLRGSSRSHMQQDNAAAHDAGELLDVFHDRTIRCRGIEG